MEKKPQVDPEVRAHVEARKQQVIADTLAMIDTRIKAHDEEENPAAVKILEEARVLIAKGVTQ